MLRSVRRKIASSLSEVERSEDFLFNSWLKEQPHQTIEFGSIHSSLSDTSKIVLSIDEPYQSQHFFILNKTELYPEDKNYIFEKVKANAVFFSMLIVPSKVIYHADIEPKPQGFTAKKYEFLFSSADQKNIPVKFEDVKSVNYNISMSVRLQEYNFGLHVPSNKSFVVKFETKIKKIELLNFEELLAESGQKIKIKKLKLSIFQKQNVRKLKLTQLKSLPKLYKVKVPGMGVYKSAIIKLKLRDFPEITISDTPAMNFGDVSISNQRFDFSGKETVTFFNPGGILQQEDIAVKTDLLNEPSQVREAVKQLLKKYHKVEWDKQKDKNIYLTAQENEAAKFLADSEHALLSEKIGSERMKETLAALKYLYDNRIVKNVLILSGKNESGYEITEESILNRFGWMGKVNKFLPGLSCTLVNGSDDERTDAWSKNSFIHIAGYNTAADDLHLKMLEEAKLKRFDCIILDRVEQTLDADEKLKLLLSSINPEILWALSNIINEDILEAVNSNLSSRLAIEKHKIVPKLENVRSQNFIKHEEYWLPLNSNQQFEYGETMTGCRKELRRVLESGNPFRFQANIFMLLHKVYQVCNFAHGYDYSPKTELLLDHLKIIQANESKVLILSQYDRQGTKKIERLLDEHKINYITAPNGLSADELKKSISRFKAKDSITVFLTNIKENRIHFGDFIVPYIIRFDSWWNPAIITHSQNLFDLEKISKSSTGPVMMTYHTFGTIEEKIKILMTQRGLLEHNILDVMSINSINDLVSIDDWLEIFELPVERKFEFQTLIDSTQAKIVKLSLGDYRATLTKFFFALGYTNVDILEHDDSASFDLTGIGKSGKRNVNMSGRVILDKNIAEKDFRQILNDEALFENRNTFIIRRGIFDDNLKKMAKGLSNITLIDDARLAKYFVYLNLVHPAEE